MSAFGPLAAYFEDYAMSPADILAVFPERHAFTPGIEAFTNVLLTSFSDCKLTCPADSVTRQGGFIPQGIHAASMLCIQLKTGTFMASREAC